MIAIQGLLSSAGAWALVPIFLVVTLESSAFLGLLFPGEMVALIAGALAAAQAFSPWSAFATVASAAVLGDVAGYALGHYWDRRCWTGGLLRAGPMAIIILGGLLISTALNLLVLRAPTT